MGEAINLVEKNDWLRENAPETAKERPIHFQLQEVHKALNSGNPNTIKKAQKFLKSDSRLENLYNEIYNYGKEGVYNRKILNKMGITKKGAFEDARINTSEILRKIGVWFDERNIQGGKNQQKALDTLFEELEDSSFFDEKNTKDNQGRELTKEQQEFFKDSKVRDAEGRLLADYSGEFSKKVSKQLHN